MRLNSELGEKWQCRKRERKCVSRCKWMRCRVWRMAYMKWERASVGSMMKRDVAEWMYALEIQQKAVEVQNRQMLVKGEPGEMKRQECGKEMTQSLITVGSWEPDCVKSRNIMWCAPQLARLRFRAQKPKRTDNGWLLFKRRQKCATKDTGKTAGSAK